MSGILPAPSAAGLGAGDQDHAVPVSLAQAAHIQSMYSPFMTDTVSMYFQQIRIGSAVCFRPCGVFTTWISFPSRFCLPYPENKKIRTKREGFPFRTTPQCCSAHTNVVAPCSQVPCWSGCPHTPCSCGQGQDSGLE